MPDLDVEIRNVQNPAFGAVVLAAFIQGYYESEKAKEGVPFQYLFLVLPMIIHSDIYQILASTRLGLRHMAEKFTSSEQAATDLLLSVNRGARLLRGLTADSVGIILLTGLARLEPTTGRLIPTKVQQFDNRHEIPEEAAEAKKLGKWFAQLSVFEVGSILKVTF